MPGVDLCTNAMCSCRFFSIAVSKGVCDVDYD
jgi:hypothetical protein